MTRGAAMITLRALLFTAYFYLMTAALSFYGVFGCRYSAPRALALGKLWARLGVAGARILAGIELDVRGLDHLPAGAALIAAQHQSAFDTMLWLLLLPRPAYVLKQELARLPLFGPLTLRSGMIPVDRSGGAASLRAMLSGTARAVQDGRQVVIFPEGTRANPDAPPSLQRGVAAIAARTHLPVIPVQTDSGRCWGRRTLHKRPGTIHVRILPPLPAGLPRDALMDRLQDIFATPVDATVDNPPPPL